MADGKIKISELSSALQINDDAVFPYSQDNSGTETTFGAVITQIARKIAEGVSLTNLQTTNKTLVSAINEIAQGGGGGGTAVVLYGTTAPTSAQGSNGNLYVQYTAGTGGADDTVDALFVKLDGAWCEIETGGGGGSGGHTIVDSEGTSLTQRTNLQFNGAYSEDNSTDDTTEINVIRSMTKAEFDELTEAEKTGLINITDDISGGLKYVKETLYSNIDESAMTILGNGDTITLTDNIFDYDEIYFEGCYFETTNATDKKITHIAVTKVMKETIALAKSKYGSGQYEGMFDVAHNFIGAGTIYASMYCLKVPTDNSFYVAFKYVQGWSANQCTLTRIIGVKYLSDSEHTYSEDEQIVGTWIDGSTLYERTLVLRESGVDKYTFTGNMTEGGHYAVGLTGIDKIWLDGLYAKRGRVGTDTDYTDIDVNSAEIVTVFRHSDGSLYFKNVFVPTDIILTIRYTKSST